MKRLGAASAILLLVSVTFARAAESERDRRDQAKIDLRLSGDWVIGWYPWVAVTIGVDGRGGLTIGREADYSFLSSYSLKLIDEAGETVFESVFDARTDPRADEIVVYGKGRRLLFQIGGPIDPPEGRYLLQIFLAPKDGGGFGPAEGQITVRHPNREEALVLAALGDRPPVFWFGEGVPKGLTHIDVPSSLEHAIGFDMFLRRLLSAKGCPGKQCSSAFEGVDVEALGKKMAGAFFEPEVAALAYGVYVLTGQDQKAKSVREATIAEYPEVEWLLNVKPGPLVKGWTFLRDARPSTLRYRWQ